MDCLSQQVPELVSLGRVFRSTAPVELTESETEYVVRCVKHIMDGYVVLDFTISNTIEEQVMTMDVFFFLCCCWCHQEHYEMLSRGENVMCVALNFFAVVLLVLVGMECRGWPDLTSIFPVLSS